MFALYNVNVNFPSNKWIKQYIIHPAEQRWKMIQRLQICGKTAKPWPGGDGLLQLESAGKDSHSWITSRIDGCVYAYPEPQTN